MYNIEGYKEENFTQACALASVLAQRYQRRVHVMSAAEYWVAPCSMAAFNEEGKRI